MSTIIMPTRHDIWFDMQMHRCVPGGMLIGVAMTMTFHTNRVIHLLQQQMPYKVEGISWYVRSI